MRAPQIGRNTLVFSCNSNLAEHSDDPIGFSFGSVVLNDKSITQIGAYWGFDDVVAIVSNSMSYTRVHLDSSVLTMTVDMVSPPKSWEISPADIGSFTHINMKIDRISLEDPEGILGETAIMRPDAEGKPIMEASGNDGKGLLRFEAEHYEVTSLLP